MTLAWREKYLNKITCGDCLELMRDLPDNSIDLVVTDPPYGFGRFDSDGKDYLEALKPCLDQIARVCKPGSSAFVFSNTRDIPRIANEMPLQFYRLLWMYKPADMTYPLKGWLLTSEAINWFCKGDTPTNLVERKPYKHDTYLHYKVGKEGVEGHPTVKPLVVISDLVSRCPSSGIVLDPFLGSGTTAVAATNLEREFIGFEINPDYCAIAQKRLDAVRNQGDLFRKQAQ